jgi:hypothetical protein
VFQEELIEVVSGFSFLFVAPKSLLNRPRNELTINGRKFLGYSQKGGLQPKNWTAQNVSFLAKIDTPRKGRFCQEEI